MTSSSVSGRHEGKTQLMAFNRWMVILATFLAVSVVHSVIAFADAESEERKPNVIVILADDLGYSDLACYGA